MSQTQPLKVANLNVPAESVAFVRRYGGGGEPLVEVGLMGDAPPFRQRNVNGLAVIDRHAAEVRRLSGQDAEAAWEWAQSLTSPEATPARPPAHPVAENAPPAADASARVVAAPAK